MIRLTETEARARLESMLQPASEPTLTSDEVDELLELARRADEVDAAPGDAAWDPTWDLNAGAAEGWRRKAGKAAGRFDVSVDGDVLHRAQAFANCLKMAERYANRVYASVRLGHGSETGDVIAN